MANERPLTLADCRRLLADFALPDQFDSALNQCIERIYSEGQWPGSKVEVDLAPYVEDYIITLPYEYETLMACNWNRSSIPIADINAEYVPRGTGTQTPGEGSGSIIDMGLVPTADDGDFPIYRHKYKLAFQYITGQDLTGLVRRRFLYLTDEQDYVYPSHLGALKNGLLAVRYENEGDLDRATGYWTRCFDFLSNASAQTKIGSRQPLNGAFNTAGIGGNHSFY